MPGLCMVNNPQRQSVWTDMGPKKKVLRELPQVPGTRKSISKDASRTARVPGLRMSKNGNKYWETRENRSDKRGTKL